LHSEIETRFRYLKNMDKLIGREREIRELDRVCQSKRSELVILYGRRRVGKTFLVRSYFQGIYDFHFVGAHNKKQATQLSNFRQSLVKYGYTDAPELKDWTQAFACLAELLEKSNSVRKIVFIDEMPWIDTQQSDFLSSFEYFWNGWVAERDDIVLIACGSATSWMKEKLEHNQGGLHNRKTCQIYLRPFTLHECREYLLNQGIDWDEYQITQCYMVMGGVPYYLSLLHSELSLTQNIDELFFRHNAELREEFNELYPALFRNSDRYVAIVRFLATNRQGFLRGEIEKATGFSGGSLTKVLQNLERCDFITTYNQFGCHSKLTRYRLCDFYTIFYLKYVADDHSHDEQYWSHHCNDRSVESWEGFTFEQICFSHLDQIKYGLGISGMATDASTWRYVAKKDESEEEKHRRGTQVDLVIQRADKILHLCEMKFASSEYTITSDYAEKLRYRQSLFMSENKIKHGVVFTFVTPYGVAKGKYYNMLHSELTLKDLFRL